MQTATSQGSSFWNVPSVLAGTLTDQAASGRLGRPGGRRTPPWAQADGPGTSVPAGRVGKTAGCQPQPGSISTLGPPALAHFLWPRFLSGFTPHVPLTDKTSQWPLLRVTGVAAHLSSHRCPLCFW